MTLSGLKPMPLGPLHQHPADLPETVVQRALRRHECARCQRPMVRAMSPEDLVLYEMTGLCPACRALFDALGH